MGDNMIVMSLVLGIMFMFLEWWSRFDNLKKLKKMQNIILITRFCDGHFRWPPNFFFCESKFRFTNIADLNLDSQNIDDLNLDSQILQI